MVVVSGLRFEFFFFCTYGHVLVFQKCNGPDMFLWIRHYVVEVCVLLSALLVHNEMMDNHKHSGDISNFATCKRHFIEIVLFTKSQAIIGSV